MGEVGKTQDIPFGSRGSAPKHPGLSLNVATPLTEHLLLAWRSLGSYPAALSKGNSLITELSNYRH